MTPTITREARDWLLEQCGADWAFRKALDMMPLTPSDDLDAVRARWQPKTRGGYEYEIFAERHGWLYGKYHDERGKPWPGKWAEKSGRMAEYIDRDSHPYHLVPISPHATLIAELKTVDMHQPSEMYSLCKRAADALEKLP